MTTASADRTLRDAQLLIGREWVSASSGGRVDHVSPITGRAQGGVAMAGVEEINAAVAAAKESSSAWRALSGDRRLRILQRLK